MMLLALLLCALPIVFCADSRCTAYHGHCQENYHHCSGRYASGMCSGHASRQCCLPSHSTSTGGISQACLNCICKQESGCRPLNCRMDVNSDSCGYFQLKYVYWSDCGKPGGSLEACAKNKACAESCVRKYMHKYGTYCTRGRTPRCEDYARIHNGGPHGCRNYSTKHYWAQVASHGCSANS